MLPEYLRFVVSDPDTANQYFTKFLYRKDAGQYKKYVVPDRILHKCWALNDPNYHPVVADKYLFEKFYERHDINVVKSLAHNYNSLFFMGKEIIDIDSPATFRHVLAGIFGNARKHKTLIIKKNIGSCGGASIFKIDNRDLFEDMDKVERIYREVVKSGYIFQEFVLQHEELNRLNPSCLNTMRMDSFTSRDGKSNVYSAFLRLGLSRSHVDNVGSGGLYVGINPDDGSLFQKGWTDFSHGMARNHTSHPETEICFKGIKIPYFKEAVELVCKAAELVPRLRILGWDVGITPTGPVIIEANECPGITHSEVAQGGFYENPVFKEVLKELKSGGRVQKSPGKEVSVAREGA